MGWSDCIGMLNPIMTRGTPLSVSNPNRPTSHTYYKATYSTYIERHKLISGMHLPNFNSPSFPSFLSLRLCSGWDAFVVGLGAMTSDAE